MPVSSLVLHLSPDSELRSDALEAIQGHPAFLIGETSALLLPAALKTEDEGQNKDCWRWLNALPGVDFVEVLSVVFPTESPAQEQSGLNVWPRRSRSPQPSSSPLGSGA